MTGKYIVIEGGENVGKSTQAAIVSNKLNARLVREPGGTGIGEAIRHLLLSADYEKQPETEVLLHAAQRSELASKVIAPCLDKGIDVVSDRSWLSSAAYQGAQGIDYYKILEVNRFALGRLIRPDLCVILDAEPEEAAKRSPEKVADYYESMDVSFHNQLRENFLDLSVKVGAVVIDALQTTEDVTEQILSAVHDRFGYMK